MLMERETSQELKQFSCAAMESGALTSIPTQEFIVQPMEAEEYLTRCFQSFCVDEFDDMVGKGEIVDPSTHHTRITDDESTSSEFSADSFASFTVTPRDDIDAETEPTPPAPKERKGVPEKRQIFVRFATHADGKLVTTTDTYPGMTDYEQRNSWYRPKDFRKFRRQAGRRAQSASSSSYYRNYLKAHKACQSSEMYARITSHHTKLLSNPKYRGCEATIFPNKNAERKSILSSILQFESQWKTCDLMTDEERTAELGKFSKELTLVHQRLARIVALGDQAVVGNGSEDKDSETTVTEPPREVQMVEI